MGLLEYMLARFQLYLLAVARIGGVIATAPPFNYRTIPVQIKIGLALMMGLMVLIAAISLSAWMNTRFFRGMWVAM